MIVNPRTLKNVFERDLSELSETNSFPKIIYFDSFFPDNEYCMKVIKRFLVMEYHRRMENSFISKGNIEFNEIITGIESKIKAYYPKVPNQNNTYDCGIYLLTYAELFFNNPEYILSQLDISVNND
jgi:Ulp1 family protease